MKKVLFALISSLMALIVSADAPAAQKAPVFSTKAAIVGEKTTFKAGEKIAVKIVCSYPEGTHEVGSWRAFAYLRDIPEGFEKMPGFKVKADRDPKWSAVETNQGYWFKTKQRKNKEFLVELDTKGWPEGDYRLGIRNTFQPIVKDEKYIYRSGSISFSLEK